MVHLIFGIVRVLIGLVGILWLCGGIFGVAYAASDRAWVPALLALFMALLGLCLAYSAFVRAPWERTPSRRGS